MRERQYSFLFRRNRPSTPPAGNTAHDFARSCRKLDLSERVFGAFLAQINDVSSCVRIVQEFRAVENEAQRWDLIAEEANSPMHQYAWVKACTDAFATCGELQLIVVGADQPRALGPFIMRSGPLNRMECLGVAELYEPTDFPYSDFDSLACLIDVLVRLRRPLLLRRVPADSPVLNALKEALKSRGVLITRAATGYPWIQLDASWTQPEEKLSASRRSSFRRARRKAHSIGPIDYEVLSPRPHELPPLLAESFRVEAAGWKGRTGSALLSDPHRRQFYEKYATIASEKGILRLSFMRIGGEVAATQIAVESGGRFWLLKVGYDERFARCSPGHLLMVETLRYAAERGLRTFEFLGSAEPWTQVWTTDVRPCVSVWAYPNNFRGLAAFVWDAVRFGWERLHRHFSV
jgi:Acetyltransferase (GNAT) domain